jgi:hypothetical protein
VIPASYSGVPFSAPNGFSKTLTFVNNSVRPEALATPPLFPLLQGKKASLVRPTSGYLFRFYFRKALALMPRCSERESDGLPKFAQFGGSSKRLSGCSAVPYQNRGLIRNEEAEGFGPGNSKPRPIFSAHIKRKSRS